MAYTLIYSGNQTGGNRTITIQDGSARADVGNITLPGKNYAAYGGPVDQNMLSMIENFASSATGPSNPVTGQLWYDVSAGALKYNISTGNTATWAAIPKLDGNGNAIFSNLTVTGTSNLGPVGNVTITGGTAGQVLSTNGSGVLSWATAAGTFEQLVDVDVASKVSMESGIMWNATAVQGGVVGQWVPNQVYDASPTGGATNDF